MYLFSIYFLCTNLYLYGHHKFIPFQNQNLFKVSILNAAEMASERLNALSSEESSLRVASRTDRWLARLTRTPLARSVRSNGLNRRCFSADLLTPNCHPMMVHGRCGGQCLRDTQSNWMEGPTNPTNKLDEWLILLIKKVFWFRNCCRSVRLTSRLLPLNLVRSIFFFEFQNAASFSNLEFLT